MDKISIRGVKFDNVSSDEALNCALDFLKKDDGCARVIHTPNAEIVEMCVENHEKYELINSADLIVPDGAGVILASKVLGKRLYKGRVPGIELLEGIISKSGSENISLFFLGGKPGVAETAVEKLKIKYPDMIVCGIRDGYFKEDSSVIEQINSSNADMLVVCLGVPKQEEWMQLYRNKLNVKLMGGFGGSLDVFAGNVKRAPAFYRKFGLEWLYRLLCEPKRIIRMMKLPKFIFGSIKDKLLRVNNQ